LGHLELCPQNGPWFDKDEKVLNHFPEIIELLGGDINGGDSVILSQNSPSLLISDPIVSFLSQSLSQLLMVFIKLFLIYLRKDL
jgi:hypothetical protein